MNVTPIGCNNSDKNVEMQLIFFALPPLSSVNGHILSMLFSVSRFSMRYSLV